MRNRGNVIVSLSQLGRIPLDVIKLDRSFVRSINADTKAQALVRSMVAVAQELDFKVVAEGIETEAEELFMKGVTGAEPGVDAPVANASRPQVETRTQR